MALDGTMIGSILGFFGLVVTALSGVYVATRTNKSEKENSAQKALEETRDEAYEARLVLRDEQIANLKEEAAKHKMECSLRIEELETENDKLYTKLAKLQVSKEE